MTNDTKHFNDAVLAYAQRTGFEGRFSELPIEEQRVVIRYAQTLKDAAALIADAVKYKAAQPMFDGEFTKGGK